MKKKHIILKNDQITKNQKNNFFSVSHFFQVVLNSLHKYQPRIHIVRIESTGNNTGSSSSAATTPTSSSSTSTNHLDTTKTSAAMISSSPKLTMDALCVLSRSLYQNQQNFHTINDHNNDICVGDDEFGQSSSTSNDCVNIFNNNGGGVGVGGGQSSNQDNQCLSSISPVVSSNSSSSNIDGGITITGSNLLSSDNGGERTNNNNNSIINEDCIDSFCGGNKIVTYTFKETQFIAVTAYQNEDVSNNNNYF